MSADEITVRKLGPPMPPPLGSGNLKKDARPLTRSQVEQQARQARHGMCVEHVRVDGLREPICIPRGGDREALIREAKALSGVSPQ